MTFYAPRLFRASSHVRFVGAVHEAPDKPSGEKVPHDIYFNWSPTNNGQAKSQERWKRDLEILLREYQKKSHDPRTVFYLAQTYLSLNDWKNSYKYYKERTLLYGWDEEDFIAWHQLGLVTQYLNTQEGIFSWDEALGYYLKAFSLRPHRAEPLIMIAYHYLQEKNMPLSYLFARRAAELPFPHDDLLFVMKNMYDFVRYEILSTCAWYVKDYELGKQAACKALAAQPEHEQLQQMLIRYIDKLVEK